MWHGCAGPAPDDGATCGPFGSRRRRLWELPAQAHELLLSLTFSPAALRREVARALGRLHRARCQLDGRDADLLQAAMHDLTSRNALSEALQRRLDECHALALRRWATVRGLSALRAAWQAVRTSGTPAGELWAALTHPEGARLEAEVLREARYLVLACARVQQERALAAADWQRRALAAEDALRVARAATVQSLREAEQARCRLQQDLAAAAGEAARWRARAEASGMALATTNTATTAGPRIEAADKTTPAAPAGGHDATVPAAARASEAASPAARPAGAGRGREQAVPPASPREEGAAPDAAVPAEAGGAARGIDGRQVLCVGGIRRAVSRYRSRVERLGAGFEHHDGGIEDGVGSLEGRLQRADLVICQAGCINHEAYQRIKRHCERTGKPCVYLERPSLAHFDRALATLAPTDACRRGPG